MAKKTIRLLSLLLSVLMLVTMIPLAVSAEYQNESMGNVQDYYAVEYDSLVGKENQENTGVYVVDEEWDVDEATNTVSFYFRGETVTETYDPYRHVTSVEDAYIRANTAMVSMPTVILTAGNYSSKIDLTGSIILLGAQAGINPNVVSSEPTEPWTLNSDRVIPNLGSEEYGNETRMWMPGSMDFDAEYGGGNSDKTMHLIEIAATSGKTCRYVLDGILFQGYGAVVNDTGAGSGTREIYAQNCVFNDGYAYDTDQFRTWNRGSGVACTKKLFISNCYATGFRHLGLYSGHSSDIQVNGLCYKDNYASAFYKVKTLQWQGLNFEMKNSYFYNSDAVAKTEMQDTNKNYSDLIFYFCNDAVSNREAGTNAEKYRYTFSNNVFYNHEKIASDGTLTLPDTSPIIIAMAGTNELLTMEDNLFINTSAVNQTTPRSVLQIRYQIDKSTGLPSHAFTADNQQEIRTTAAYALNSSNVCIQNNTFCGKIYQATPNIGVNTHEDTLMESTGNVYLDSYTDTTGAVIPGTAQNHDKWVWLDITDKSDPTNRSDYINTAAITVSGDNLAADPDDAKSLSVTVAPETDSYAVAATCDTDAKNYVKYYKADASFNKLEETTAALSTANRINYYVVSIHSMDGWTSEDYHITITRPPLPGATLNGIVDEATETLSQKRDGDYFEYEVDYLDSAFTFTLDVPTGATSVLKEGETQIESEGANTFTLNLEELENLYEYSIIVTDAATSKTETYALGVLRRENHRTAVEKITLIDTGASATEPVDDNNTWSTTVPVDTAFFRFSIDISENATVVVRDPVYNAPVMASEGAYTVENLGVGSNRYSITVTAQNGEDQETWYFDISRNANTDHELLGIKNATKTEEGVYTANIEQDFFMISPSYSYGATAQVFADEACQTEIKNFRLSLTEATTTVWIRITAEDGVSSTLSKLIIHTTAELGGGSGSSGIVDDGVIGVLDGNRIENGTVYVELPENTESWDYKVIGMNGYTVKLYADQGYNLLIANTGTLNLDSGITKLYAKASKDADTKAYVIQVEALQKVTFTDQQVAWAEEYVDYLAESGVGVMKGDDKGAFNGESKLSRYEMAVMLVRFAGIDSSLYSNVKTPFQDTIVDWAANYVKAAYRSGMIGGYSVTDEEGNVTGYVFNGDNNSTRSEFLRVFTNALVGNVDTYYENNKAAIDAAVAEKEFSDLDFVADWAVSAVYTAVYQGVIEGDGDRLNPEGEITRNEIAVILTRYLKQA